MTEAEVLDAAFGSKRIAIGVVPHPQTGFADRLLFYYKARRRLMMADIPSAMLATGGAEMRHFRALA